MEICGFQRLTLLDYPGRTACTIFTGGCNFRCPFCHNASLVIDIDKSGQISEDEFFDYLKKRQGVLDGVGITGGEPLLHPEIVPFCEKIKSLDYDIKLDTNGSRPALLRELIDKGLVDYVAMDIKNSREKYAITAGIKNFDLAPIEESVSLLLENRVDYEFRTTVVNELHEKADFEKIAQWIQGAKRYFLQNFVDSGNLLGIDYTPMPKDEMRQIALYMADFVEVCETRGI